LRRRTLRQDPEQAGVRKALDRALERSESGAAVGGQRRRMGERAGVDMDSVDALAPGAADGLGKEPAAVALAGKLGDETDEGELAFVRLSEVELEHAGVAAFFVLDRVKLDRRIADDRFERIIVHDQA